MVTDFATADSGFYSDDITSNVAAVRITSLERHVVTIDGIKFKLHAIKAVLHACSRHIHFAGRRGKPLLGQVHRDPIDIDGYVLFGSQPLS